MGIKHFVIASFVSAAVARNLEQLFSQLVGGADVGSVSTLLNDLSSLASLSSPDSVYCPNSSYWEFLPATVGHVDATTPSATWQGDGCFTSMSFTGVFSADATSIALTLTGSNPTSLLCSDAYIVTTSTNIQLATVSALGATTSVSVNVTAPVDALDVSLNGINIHLLPCGLVGTVQSVLKTVSLFQGNASALAAANIDFLTERKVWPAATPFGKVVAVDKSNIRSGDYLAIGRLDGLDPMIMFGTGGVTGHSAIAVWDQGTLYISESTDSNPLGPVYWPPPYGIIRHEYDTWIALAQTAGYHVSLLPMAPQFADQFNETAYWNWFATVQGEPYGYHSMLFSFLDTYAPFANFPIPVTSSALTPVMNVLDGLLGNGTAGVTVYSMLTWGLNKRLNTTCTTLACIIAHTNANMAAGRPVHSFIEAAAIVDEDSWKFGANYSMVCSEFAAHGWKVGLGDAFPVWNDIQSNEQTPKDNYQMALYDPTRFTEATCPGGVTTLPSGNGAYCQLMGEFVMYLNEYNTVPIYAHMNEVCPSQWPEYVRCPAGNITCC